MKLVILFFGLIFSFFSFSQNKPSYSNFETRKGTIVLKVAAEYRVTPFYSEEEAFSNSAGRFTSVDFLKSGEAFSYGLEAFLSKKLSFNVQHSLRRSLVVLPFGAIENNFGIAETDEKILMGFHAFFDYHIQLFKESEIFIRLGVSTFNGGANFVTKQTFFDEAGEIAAQPEFQGNFNNEGFNFGMGYAKDRFKLFLGLYTERGNVFFSRAFPIYTPYIKLSYNIINL